MSRTPSQSMPMAGTAAALAADLAGALAAGQGMNEMLEAFLESIERALEAPRIALYDYDEIADVFELLYFRGYPPDARAELTRRMRVLDLRRATRERDPYAAAPDLQVLPLYFQETLEAALVLEGAAAIDGARCDAVRIAARFLALFLSSVRLPINRKRGPIARTDLERAREVQMSYLPSDYPVTDKYEIYGYNQSSAIVGGDYFDYFCERPGSIACVVADACGHGIAAALIMSTFRGLLHAEVCRGEMGNLFDRLNRQLHCGGELLQYLTAVLFDYDEERRTLRALNAGHFDPVLVHKDGAVSRLEGGGPPLGMFREAQYEPRSGKAAPGDLLVLFTDGLVELRGVDDEFFGVDGILAAVRDRRQLPLGEVAREVLTRAAEFSRDRPPEDDLTLFLMRFR